MNLFLLAYVIIEIFGTYTTYRMLKILNGRAERNRIIELISYTIFLAVGICIYYMANSPMINVVSNVLMIFLLTLNYRSNWKRKVVSVVIVYALLLCVEAIVYVTIKHIYLPSLEQNSNASLLPHISIRIILYAVMLLMNRIENRKKGEIISFMHWISTIAVPAASIYLLFILPIEQMSGGFFIISVFILLIANFSTFFLYDSLLIQIEKIQNLLLMKENANYLVHSKMLQNMSRAIEMLEHDFENHLIVLSELIEKDNIQETMIYMDKCILVEDTETTYIESGNPTLDSIINIKIHEADQYGIQIKHKIIIPVDIPIDAFDMTAIMAPLLDASILEVKELEQGSKSITVGCRYDKGRVFIIIRHACLDRKEKNIRKMGIQKNKALFETVKRAIERYHGSIIFNQTDDEFETSIIMFVSLDFTTWG